MPVRPCSIRNILVRAGREDVGLFLVYDADAGICIRGYLRVLDFIRNRVVFRAEASGIDDYLLQVEALMPPVLRWIMVVVWFEMSNIYPM